MHEQDRSQSYSRPVPALFLNVIVYRAFAIHCWALILNFLACVLSLPLISHHDSENLMFHSLILAPNSKTYVRAPVCREIEQLTFGHRFQSRVDRFLVVREFGVQRYLSRKVNYSSFFQRAYFSEKGFSYNEWQVKYVGWSS